MDEKHYGKIGARDDGIVILGSKSLHEIVLPIIKKLDVEPKEDPRAGKNENEGGAIEKQKAAQNQMMRMLRNMTTGEQTPTEN